ncbi:MAG TPA: hypothetical protein VIX11_10915 [Candidatus Acidoferrum sp.]
MQKPSVIVVQTPSPIFEVPTPRPTAIEPPAAPASAASATRAPANKAIVHRREVSQGPFEIDGHVFTLRVSYGCTKLDEKGEQCNDAFGDSAEWFRILDASGKVQFQQSYPVTGDDGSTSISALSLEGRSHQALQVIFSFSPATPDTGEVSQLFALHDGSLQPLMPKPWVFGQLNLPKGQSKDSFKLLASDSFEYPVNAFFFSKVNRYRLNWQDFRIDPINPSEFDVQPYQGEIEADGVINLFAKPDKNSVREHVQVGPKSHIVVLKGSADTSSPEDLPISGQIWLKIKIDGKEGYINGSSDFAAIGLQMVG